MLFQAFPGILENQIYIDFRLAVPYPNLIFDTTTSISLPSNSKPDHAPRSTLSPAGIARHAGDSMSSTIRQNTVFVDICSPQPAASSSISPLVSETTTA